MCDVPERIAPVYKGLPSSGVSDTVVSDDGISPTDHASNPRIRA
jgi:hypothetical protein